MHRFIAVLLISISFLAAPAYAQSKKELAAVDLQLSQRLSTLESRMLTGDPAAERLMQRMDALETSQRTLTGEVETLRFERDQLSNQLGALASELQTKQALIDRMQIHLDAVDLVASEPRSPRVQPNNASRTYGQDSGYNGGTVTQFDSYSGQPSYSQSPSIDTYAQQPSYDPSYDSGHVSQIPSAPIFREETIGVQADYQNDVTELGKAGQTKLAEGDFAGAQTAFRQYLEFNPDASDKGEINFWLGESYFVRGGYADAADAYITSMRTDPKGVKAPDAMVRLAATLRELGNKAEACQTLATFPSQFPDASSSTKEKARVEAARTGC